MPARYLNNYSGKSKALILSIASLAVAASLASSIYGFYESSKRLGANLPLPSAATTHPQPSFDIQSTLSAGWFGRPDGALQNIGTTSPNLELKGISASDKTTLAGAYIAEAGKPEAFYREGDQLPGGAGTLAKVYSDHVTIDRAGSSYSLAFPLAKAAKPTDSQ